MAHKVLMVTRVGLLVSDPDALGIGKYVGINVGEQCKSKILANKNERLKIRVKFNM